MTRRNGLGALHGSMFLKKKKEMYLLYYILDKSGPRK